MRIIIIDRMVIGVEIPGIIPVAMIILVLDCGNHAIRTEWTLIPSSTTGDNFRSQVD